MKQLSVKEISSILSTRTLFPKKHPGKQPPHQNWEPQNKAAIVILWGLLVYPQLDPDLAKERNHSVTVSDLVHLFTEYLGSKQNCMEILSLLKHYDYIRFLDEETMIAGTELFTAVDALKMYQLFRTSMLTRKIILGNSFNK